MTKVLPPKKEKIFNYGIFLSIVLCLIATLLIDTSIVKMYDIVDKNFIPVQEKNALFSVNTVMSLFFQYLLIRYVKSIFNNQINRLNVGLLYKTMVISLSVTSILFAYIIFQLFYSSYYFSFAVILIIVISYGTAAAFIISLSLLFLSWFRLNHDLVTFLYFLSMSIIAFNLIITAVYTTLNVFDRPTQIREFVGGSMDISVGRFVILDNIYKISAIASFVSIWVTTAILLSKYRNRLISSIAYGLILTVPLAYFLINYSYQYIFGNLLTYYLTSDPITVSIILTAFLTLSKPAGGFTFGIVFWKISNNLRYERNIKKYMLLSGWGIFLLFTTNQAIGQSLTPYPPFGLVTITVLMLAGNLTLLGISNAAISVSTNSNLRESILKRVIDAKLLGSIGKAERDTALKKAVEKIIQDKETYKEEKKIDIDLDEKELKKYIDFIIDEVKENNRKGDTTQKI
jgi:hypothetical protein